ncbi:hypothetical protein PILCRDRAFT_385216 [Piloderma croceum F 1598]|uniref:Uncharacterized protein n=1 Tax=Piloderma croceum (strain F 1598) TaxID=765440 RepID=A0A0C3FXZ5_PILCF|nr:hypothetical protein PILCRDRAFT_385216 [Piloderma croceum F 1598]
MTFISIHFFKHKRMAQFSEESFLDEKLFESTTPSSYLNMDPFDVYQRDASSGLVALGGVCASVVFGIICISCGIYIALHSGTIDDVALPPSWRITSFHPDATVYTGFIAILHTESSVKTEILSLSLNLAVTACTESIGFVHSIALKSALAAESHLHSNTNLRLLTAARGNPWTNPNGTLFNGIMAILLIVSYVSSTLVFIPFQSPVVEDSLQEWWFTCIFAPPVLTLGIVIMLQAIIAMAGLYHTRVLTWSSSPLDTAAALLHDGKLTRCPGRCMHNVVNSTIYLGPCPPSERQPSAWESHPRIKKIIIMLWCLVLGSAAWCCIIAIIWTKELGKMYGPVVNSWSILPNDRTNGVSRSDVVDPNHGFSAASWFFMFGIFILIQGGMTLGLHCSEVIANVVRDEMIWRRATSEAGTKPITNPILAVFMNWPSVSLLIAKPVLHWMFGLSLGAQGFSQPVGAWFIQVEWYMQTTQIIYLTLGLFTFALISTYIARRHPRGPQPAAYGHLQTLANLVDEWSSMMWWGHKSDDNVICHAGTSNFPRPPVRMGRWYAGNLLAHKSG